MKKIKRVPIINNDDDNNSLIEVNLTNPPYTFPYKLIKPQYFKLHIQNHLIKPVEIIDKKENLDKENCANFSDEDNEESTLDILKEFGLIGCISAEPDLSTNYKFILREELDSKYDHR